MRKTVASYLLTAFLLASLLPAQLSRYPYFINTAAGSYPWGDGGPAAAALLESPRGIALDGNGNVYICDDGDQRIRMVSASTGNITTAPGGTGHNCYAITADAAGNIYFTDGIYRIYKLTAAGSLTIIAGGSSQGFTGDGGKATSASLFWPWGLAIDSDGNIYFADNGNNRVRKIGTDGIIQTVAGTGSTSYNGDGGKATAANLSGPRGIAFDNAGNLYIADYGNQRVRMVTPDGMISTVAGTGTNGFSGDGGPAAKASLQYPSAVMADGAGNIYISTTGRVREVSADGNIRTLAGTGSTTYSGDGGPAINAQLGPSGIAMDADGNLLIADNANGRVRSITPAGNISTVVGTTHFSGDSGPATSAILHNPYSVAFDGAGNLYIADYSNYRVRKVSPSGSISTVAGTGSLIGNSSSGMATQVSMLPNDVAVDAAGNVYIADLSFCRVRLVSPDGTTRTVAGNGSCSDNGDGGAATDAALIPWGVAVDAAGNVYISDPNHSRVRKVTADGTISTFAGTGRSGAGVDGVPANQSPLRSPYGVAVDNGGNIYIADYGDYRIRMVSPDGMISTVAGNGAIGFTLNDGKPATSVSIAYPMSMATDADGNLYFTESAVGYVRKVDRSGILTTLAGFPSYGFSGDGGPASSASLSSNVRGIVVDANGDLYFADTGNQRIRKLMINSPVRLDIKGGNNQSVPLGEYTVQPLVAQLMGRASLGVPNVNVTFTVTAGAATVYPTTAMSDSNGKVAVNVRIGDKPGPVTISAGVSGMPPTVFTVNAVDPDAAPAGSPVISSGGIVGAGFSVPAVQEVSANGIVTLLGNNFAAAGTKKSVGASDLVKGQLPVNLAGICVQVGAVRAPLLGVSPNQLTLQIPNAALSKDAFVQVIQNCDTPNEIRGNLRSVMVRYATPEFFHAAVADSGGKSPVSARVMASGEVIGASRPAQPGETISIYGTGFGPTSPPMNPGEIRAASAGVVLPAKVTIGGVTLSGSDVVYAGIASGTALSQVPGLEGFATNAGVYELRIRVPDAVADGDQPVMLSLGLYSTPAGGYLTVKR